MTVPVWVWVLTSVGIAAVFTVSLLVGRKAHVITLREAAVWVAGYVSLASAFGVGIGLVAGGRYAGEYFAGYVTEYALSIDNLFVFAIILATFRVPRELQGRVVLIGIAIAIVLRGGLIAVGAALIVKFSWVFYIFGAALIVTAVHLLRSKPDQVPPEPKAVVLLRRFLPVSRDYDGTSLITRVRGQRMATPLLAVILALGATDVVFALDSIPAIFGLTVEPFIVFTSNAFALLGLSELYFLLDGLLERLRYLSIGLAVVLIFIGVKLVLQALAENTLPFISGGGPVEWVPHIGIGVSLGVIGGVLLVTVLASALIARPPREQA